MDTKKLQIDLLSNESIEIPTAFVIGKKKISKGSLWWKKSTTEIVIHKLSVSYVTRRDIEIIYRFKPLEVYDTHIKYESLKLEFEAGILEANLWLDYAGVGDQYNFTYRISA